MLEIKITIGADSSIERLADVLAKLAMARGGAEDAPAGDGPADEAAPVRDPAPAAETKEVTMADLRAAVGPKLKELTERHGPEKAKEIMRAAFEAVGAKEMNTSRIPQERRAEFIKAVEGLS